jgi:hypothetical protein
MPEKEAVRRYNETILFLQTLATMVVNTNSYLPCRMSIHLMASVSLTLPR